MMVDATLIEFYGDVKSRRGWLLSDDRGHTIGFVDSGGTPADLEGAARALGLGIHGPGEYGQMREVGGRSLLFLEHPKYRRMGLVTPVPREGGGTIVTTGGVPIFGITRYTYPVRPPRVSQDECEPLRLMLGVEGLNSLARGETVVVNGWCRSYRSMRGLVTHGRAWLEATCV